MAPYTKARSPLEEILPPSGMNEGVSLLMAGNMAACVVNGGWPSRLNQLSALVVAL
ncbi:hypothetical protein ACFOTA_15125 [Chitinophaga sp. GCM10012297]|uniref:Uncharacterized protein n=1 Tax=Chitinophaga chungangae TaxID=2821488 RepID=A0ABS3YFU5_9BACT|nr:hypothetical protein [Chitinophaga chungangae]MBO9153551.1 hypothetical protein [Chitinophaga chungangae]